MLVGLLVDVSGSMTNAIHNPAGPALNRLEAFRDSLKSLVERGRELSRKPPNQGDSRVRLFAYGFGFGNPLSVLLGRRGPAVRDLLALHEMNTSLVSIVDVADNWARYEAHLVDLAVDMLGSTPMREGLEMVRDRFDAELQTDAFHDTSVLFLLSDGMPNRGTERAVAELAAAIKDRGHILVSCYVTDADLTEPRRLYSRPYPGWPEGAKLMFECASPVAPDSVFADYLLEYGWTVDDPARLFAQINRSDVLTEFMQAVITPVSPPTASAASKSLKVFVSYAHEDEDFRTQLEKHLSALRRRGLISIWNDRRITAGTEWKGAIDANLDSADLILLLISEDFLHSDYCYDIELKRALERHEANDAMVVPIMLRPVDWHGTPFSKLAALPTDARPITNWRSRASAFTDVAAGIRKAIEQILERR